MLYRNGDRFSSGAATYTYHPATEQERTPRIFLTVSFDGIDTEAFLDTGAPYVVCKPQIARSSPANTPSANRSAQQPLDLLVEQNWLLKEINANLLVLL